MSNPRLLYVPVETKAREFLGKTFLAARAVERGWTVILGEANKVRDYMLEQPAGAYIEIGIPEKKAKRLENLRGSGYRIANMCEEGLVYSNGLEYCTRKLGRTSIAMTDRLLVVGSRNADDIRTNLPDIAAKVAVTGNPRFDTLLAGPRCVYRRDANAIKDEFGRFLLVNTNFTRANPYGGLQMSRYTAHLAKLRKRGMVISAEQEEFVYRFVTYQQRLMQGLQKVIQELVSSGVVDRVLIRPHPVENRNTWVDWAKPIDRVDVRWDGSAIEWMLAAEAVLHPGCTTALEGLMLDRPVFSYFPEQDNEFINPADHVSEIVTGAEDLAKRLVEVRKNDETQLRARFAEQRERLGHFIANVEAPYAADRILDVLDQLDLPETKDVKPVAAQGFISSLRKTIRKWREPVKARVERRRQKFPHLGKEEADWVVEQWVESGVLKQAPRIDVLAERILLFH